MSTVSIQTLENKPSQSESIAQPSIKISETSTSENPSTAPLTIENLEIDNSNFKIVKTTGVPAPFPLAVGDNFFGKTLIYLNNLAIRIWKSLFSYQIFCQIKPNKSLDLLLKKAEEKIIKT